MAIIVEESWKPITAKSAHEVTETRGHPWGERCHVPTNECGGARRRRVLVRRRRARTGAHQNNEDR